MSRRSSRSFLHWFFYAVFAALFGGSGIGECNTCVCNLRASG